MQAHGLRRPAGSAELTHRLACQQDGFATPDEVSRIGQHELQQLLAQRLALRRQQGSAADEVAALAEAHEASQAGFERLFEPLFERRFERRLVRPQFGPPGTPAGLDAQGIRRPVAGVAQAQVSAGGLPFDVDMARHLHRHIQPVARPADTGDARRPHPRQAEVDFLGVRQRRAGG